MSIYKIWKVKMNGSNSSYYTIYSGSEKIAQKINSRRSAEYMAAAPYLFSALKCALVEMKVELRECGHDPSVGINATSLIIAIQNAEQAIIMAEGRA